MDSIIGVSWPRSGHHLLVRLLTLYFGPSFRYCDYYGGIEGCCKSVPCTRLGEIHFTKSHDFDFTLPQIPGRKYLIQYRAFLPSAVSNYELFLLRQPRDVDSVASFVSFVSSQFTAYRTFTRRWVTSGFAQGQLVLRYEDLIDDPHAGLARAVQWFAPDTTPDEGRVAAAVAEVSGEKVEAWKVQPLAKAGVHDPRDLSDFRHYEPRLFAALGRLQLTRDEVHGRFRALLGRAPAEEAYLGFQGLDSLTALDDALRASPEYRARQASAAAAPPPAPPPGAAPGSTP